MKQMKNSGIEWIGKIPSDWAVLRNKYNFDLNKNLVGTAYKDTQLLSLTKNGIKAITEDDQKGKVPTSFATYQTVDKDDIVMCLFDLDVSAVFSGISPYEGMISPAYKCFKCKEHLFPQYIDYYFKTVFVDRKYKRYSKNVRYSIGSDEFMMLPILVPPLEVQKSIANFLDQKCSEIDSLSADIQSQIDILEEYKKSVITEAVTKGLNPNVEMKDSKVNWMGNIPLNWKLLQLKHLCMFKTGGTPSGNLGINMENDGYQWITASDMNDTLKIKSSVKYITKNTVKQCKYQLFPPNSILLVCIASVGKMGIIDKYSYSNQQITALKPNNNILPLFLLYQMKAMENNIMADAHSNVVPIINTTYLSSIKCLLPPIPEQQEIVDYLDNKCTEIDEIIADKKAQLETLAEYKKSLIYEYVTGKKEVVQ